MEEHAAAGLSQLVAIHHHSCGLQAKNFDAGHAMPRAMPCSGLHNLAKLIPDKQQHKVWPGCCGICCTPIQLADPLWTKLCVMTSCMAFDLTQ